MAEDRDPRVNEYQFLIGIDFGHIYSKLSVAHINDLFNIFTVDKWDKVSESNDIETSIVYNRNGEPYLVGEASELGEGDIYIKYIMQYLFDSHANEKLENFINGLDIKAVIADFLRKFVELGLHQIRKNERFQRKSYFGDFENEKIRYCLVCGVDQQEFMRKCFIQAGIINKEDPDNRVTFTTKSEAAAYTYLDRQDRSKMYMISGQNYLFCDIGYNSISISEIQADDTSSMSKVTLITEYNDAGFGSLNQELKKYLEFIFRDKITTIASAMSKFEEDIKPSFDVWKSFEEIKFKTRDYDRDYRSKPIRVNIYETENNMYLPFFEKIARCILKIIDVTGAKHPYEKIFLSTNFSDDVVEILEDLMKFKLHIVILTDMSRGAVLYASDCCEINAIPFFLEDGEIVDDQRVEKQKKAISLNFPNLSSDYDYVIGIDFGTTFSGSSFARRDKKGGIKEIKRWPHRKSEAEKVPTTLVYNKKGQKFTSYWGQRGLRDLSNYDEELLAYFKLLLVSSDLLASYEERKNRQQIEELNYLYFDFVKEHQLDTTKLVATYLQLFNRWVCNQIEKMEHGNKVLRLLKKKPNIAYVLTIPAMYRINGRKAMTDAAIEANIIRKDQKDTHLILITEPAAAALYYENLYLKTLNYKDHGSSSTFIVCDAGGGTVDLLTFRLSIEENLNGQDTNVIRQLGNGRGDTCGSVYIDKEFKKLIKNIYDEDLKLGSSSFDEIYSTYFEKKFIKEVKSTENLDEKIPFSIPDRKNGGNQIFIKHNMIVGEGKNRKLNIPYKIMRDKVFEPVIQRIIKLLDEQIEDTLRYSSTVDAIILVGGFGSSEYLKERLEENYKDIKVEVPENGLNVVSQGAVSYALNPRLVSQLTLDNDYDIHGVDTNESTGITRNLKKASRGNAANTFLDEDQVDFIVGLDFGTKYSGLSYSRPNKDSEIVVPYDWIGEMHNTSQFRKAPSLLVFNNRKGSFEELWGLEAEQYELREYEFLVEDFKLLLSPEGVDGFYSRDNKIIRYGDVLELISNYLRMFSKQIEEYIKKRELKRMIKLKYVLTIPPIWDSSVKQVMVEAAVLAGIVKEDKIKDLMVASEIEVAALDVVKNTSFLQRQHSDTTFIVCDAGGATVDLITFRITKEECLYQVNAGGGDTCGSMYLDVNFRKYITEFYDSIGMQHSTLNLRSAMDKFRKDWKLNFKSRELHDRVYELPLPSYPRIPVGFNMLGSTNDDNSILRMPWEDMQKKVIDPVIRRIELLLDWQIEKVGTEEKIDSIILIGGFSKNQYLQERLKRRYSPMIDIVAPENGITAVSRGAVIYGQDPNALPSLHRRFFNQSYALQVHARFDPVKDSHLEPFKNSHGNDYASNRLVYFVKKDDEVDIGLNEFEKDVYVEYPKNAVIAIFACDRDLQDVRGTSRYVTNRHTRIMEAKINMPAIPSKKKNDKIPFKIRLQIYENSLTLFVQCQDPEVDKMITGPSEKGVKLAYTRIGTGPYAVEKSSILKRTYL